MSGGSWHYSFRHVEEMADGLANSDNPLRAAFAAHLRKVAKAMHDIEWADSGDYARGAEDTAILDVLGPIDADLVSSVIAQLTTTVDHLKAIADQADTGTLATAPPTGSQ